MLISNNNKRRKRLNSCIILMGYPVRGNPFNHATYRHQNPTKSCRKKSWILNTLREASINEKINGHWWTLMFKTKREASINGTINGH